MVSSKTNTHPLQSPQWAQFRQKWGNEVVKTPYGFVNLHKVPYLNLKIGTFIRGPKPTKEMISWLTDFGKKNKVIFIKLEPFIKQEEKLTSNLKT